MSEEKKQIRFRPTGKLGPGKAQLVRMHEPALQRLDRWIAQQPEPLSRPEAIRRLVDKQLGRRFA